MISVRMKSPGWGGFFMGMAFARRTTASDPYGKSPYPYLISCSLSLNTCQSKNVRSLKQALARGGPTADDISGERLPNYVRGFSTPHSCRQMRSFIAESLSQAAKTGPSSSLNTPKHLQPPEQVSVPAVPPNHGVWLFCHMQKSAQHGKLIHTKRLTAFPLKHEQTIRAAVTCTGIGLHSGAPVSLRILPASAGTGIVFRRTDLDGF